MAKKRKVVDTFDWNAPLAGRDESWVSPLELAQRDAVAKRAVDFSDVEAGSGSTEPDPVPDPSLVDRYFALQDSARQAAIGGVNRTIGALGFTGANDGLNFGPGETARAIAGPTIDAILGEGTFAEREAAARKFYGEMVQTGSQQAANSEAALKVADLPWPLHKGAQAVTDVLSSPSSLGSIPGGPFAAIPAADVYAQEYTAGIQGGLSDKEARARAQAMAGVEAGVSVIPAGKFLSKIPGVNRFIGNEAKQFLAGRASNVIGGTIKTAAGEAAEEGVTEAVQAGIDSSIANSDASDKARAFSATQAPKNATELWNRVERATLAGAAGGTMLGGPHVGFEDAAKAGQLAAEVNSKYADYVKLAESENKRKAGPKPRIKVPAPALAEEQQATAAAEVEGQSATDEIDQMLGGLRSEQRATGPGGATTRQVLEEISKGISSGGARQLATRMNRGDVVLVERDTHIPNAEARGSAGFYDGKRTYIVANRMDPSKPVLGQVLDVLAHETTHAGDVSGNITNKLVGEKNNARLTKMIMDTARKQAGNDDFINVDPKSPEFADLTPEQKATVFAVQNTDNFGASSLETVAYYVNFARDAAQQRRSRKAAAAVWQDVKSAVKDKFGVNPSLNDVAYLSEKLLHEAASTNKPLTGSVEETVQKYGGEPTTTGLNMIGGPEATGFTQAQTEGNTYRGRVDDKERFEFSDKDSKVTEDDFLIQDVMDGKIVPLKAIFQHDELYKQYPGIGDMIKVKVDKTMTPNQYGSFHASTGTLSVNPEVLRGNKQRLRKLILHEVQHGLQAIEGFVKGAAPSALIDPNIQQEFHKEGSRLENVPANFEIGVALRNMTPADKTAWNKLITDVQDESGPLTIEETAALFLDEGYGERSQSQLIRGQQNAYNRAAESFANASKQASADKKNAFDLYQRDYGETEARNTEFRADMSDDIRKKFDPESTMALAEGRVHANRTVDTKQLAKSKSGLSMSAEATGFDRGNINENDAVAKGKIRRAVERLLVPGGYLDKDLEEMLRHATSLPASMAQRGTYLNNKFREAVDENVANSNGKYTDESFRKMLSHRIDMIDEKETLEERQAAVAGLDRQYPGIGKALNELREYKLSLTRELLSQRKRDPKKLTDKERNIYKKMVYNAERYTTRAYLATYDKEIGDTYGKQMLEKFRKDPNSEQAKIVQEALDYLVNKELTVPNDDVLGKMTTEKLRRIHEAWIGPTDQYKEAAGRKQMEDNLKNMDPKTKKEIDAKAWEVVQDMLGQTESKAGMAREFTPSMRQNRTILEARSDIPAPLRKLLGEITDPLLREAISLNRMINLSTKTKFLTEAFEKGEGKWWQDTKSQAFAIKLDSPAYGPLDGKYVSQDMADAITGTVMNLRGMDEALTEVAQNGDLLMKVLAGKAFPVMKHIMSAQKTYGVVFDFYNGLVNLVGAIGLMAPMNGLVPFGSTSWKGMSGAGKTLLLDIWDRKVSENNSALVEELLLAGVTDSATMGEFKGHAYDGIKKQLAKIGGANLTPRKVFTTALRWAMGNHSLGNALRTAYAFMDVWVKVSTYYDRKDFNTKMNKAEGWGLSEDEIIRKSGFEASGTNISYERAIPLAKMAEKNIPLFMFLTYKTEVVRATAASFKRGIEDLRLSAQAKTPEGRRMAAAQGIKRLAGTSAVLGTLIGGTLKALSAEDDDEKKKRFLDFDWMQNAVMTKLGKNSDGNEVMLNISRLDPLGPMNELVTTIATAPEGRFTENAVDAFGDYFFAESKGVFAVYQLLHDATVASLATALGNEGLRDFDMDLKRKGIIERNYPELYKQLQKLPGDIGQNSAEVFERIFLPAHAKAIMDERGKTDSTLGEALRMMGASLYVRDPDKALTGKAIEHDKAVDALKKERDEAVKAGNLDADTLKDLVAREYKSFSDLSKGYEGYLAFDNTSASDAASIIGNKKLASQVRTGAFKSQLTDTKTLDAWKKRELKKPNADRDEVMERYRELKKLYSEAD